MSKWPFVPLGEVLGHRKEFIQIDDLETYKRCRVQLHTQGVVLRDQVPGAEIKTKKQQVCKPGDFLVAEIDAKVGGYGLVPPELDGAIVSSHYFLFGIDENKLDRRFLAYFIRTPAFHEQVTAQGSTNYAAIRPGHVLHYTLPLPPLSEQRRWVKHIDATAAKIEEAKRLQLSISRTLDCFLQAALAKTFQRLIAERQCETVPLRQAAIIARGKFTHRPRNEPRFYGGEYPFIQIGDISNSDQYVRQHTQTLNEHGLQISRLFPRGTVVIAITGATVGVTGILDFACCFPDSIVGIQPRPGICTSGFVYWALEFEKHKALAQATQTTQPNINLQKLDTLTITLPSVSDQNDFVTHLSDIKTLTDRARVEQNHARQELDAMLPAILDRAFNGHL